MRILTYGEALTTARDLVEADALAQGLENEYLRGVVNLIADCFGVYERDVSARMDDVLADLRRLPFGADPYRLEAYGVARYSPHPEWRV